jgi:hypothetical protein
MQPKLKGSGFIFTRSEASFHHIEIYLAGTAAFYWLNRLFPGLVDRKGI